MNTMPIYFVAHNMDGLGYWLTSLVGPHFVFQISKVIAAKKGSGFLT